MFNVQYILKCRSEARRDLKRLETMSRLQVVFVEGISSAYCNYNETQGSLFSHFRNSKTPYMISGLSLLLFGRVLN